MILNIPFKLLNVENKVQLSISEGTKATQSRISIIDRASFMMLLKRKF